MTDLLAAIGLVLVLEGALYALFPAKMQEFMRMLLDTPPEFLRRAGLFAAIAGLGLVWLVRG